MFPVPNKETAKDEWLKIKKKAYETRLRDNKTILNKIRYGLFSRNAILYPLENYAKQLNEWADNYRSEIAKRLDSENAILSGMEEEIKQISYSINDISSRLENLVDVKQRLGAMTAISINE